MKCCNFRREVDVDKLVMGSQVGHGSFGTVHMALLHAWVSSGRKDDTLWT